jgi:hypothetical protein
METRRTFPPGVARFSSFSGYPLLSAAEQSGAIGIHQSPNLWVNVTTTQGLRRIDPLSLPPGLRKEPGTSHAFLFLDQPFKLGLGIESSPPLFQTETVTRLELEEELARVTAAIQVHQVRGSLFEIDVAVPEGMQLLSIGPPDLVESARPVQPPVQPGKGLPTPEAGQILRVQLAEAGRRQRSFTLRLRGQERVGSEGDVKLGLFAALGGGAATSTVSLFADPTVSFEVIDEPGRPDTATVPVFRVQPPDERSGVAPPGAAERVPLVVLKSHQNPPCLHGRLTRHARTVTHETRISAQVSARRIDVRQETSLQVRHGSIRSLVVRVPVSRPDLWQVQGTEMIRREELESQSDGGTARRYRLSFDPPIADRSSLTFTFQVPIPSPPGDGGEITCTVPWVLFEEGASRSTVVELTMVPGMKASANAAAWVKFDQERSDQPGAWALPAYRLVKSGTESAGFPLQVRLLRRVALPSIVAPRALLRTVLGSDNESRTHAWYWIESHPPQLSIGLPEGTQWIRSRIDGRVTEQLDRDPAGTGYLLTLPPESASKPVLLEIEYQAKGEPTGRILPPPELSEGAVILQSLWEVHVPWSRAILGVPEGWADENQWYWEIYVWKRRPWNSFSRLVDWVSGSTSTAANPADLPGQDQSDSHSYLFGRSGRPVLLRPWVVSRALVVAICSGSVLLLGFYLMFFRSRIRVVWTIVATLALLATAFAHPSTVLLVMQSAVTGLVLALLGLLIQGLIERARASAGPAGPVQAGSTAPALSPTGVGSDDSTAIRARVSSTMDYVAPLSLPAEPEPARSSQIVPSG